LTLQGRRTKEQNQSKYSARRFAKGFKPFKKEDRWRWLLKTRKNARGNLKFTKDDKKKKKGGLGSSTHEKVGSNVGQKRFRVKKTAPQHPLDACLTGRGIRD